MTDDIVNRLRLYANASIDGGWASVFKGDLNIAADEIKQLRKERDEAMALIETISNEVNVLATRPAKIIKLHDIVYLINQWGDAARKILNKKENTND